MTPEERSEGRAVSTATWLLALAALTALSLGALRLFTSSDGEFVSDYSKDDSYYYFQLARNIARGLGPTFDGIELTNGFGPVWALLLVPIYFVVDDPMVAARLGCLLSLLFFVAGVFVLARVLEREVGRWPATIAGVAGMLAPPLLTVGLQGMDFSLNLFLQVSVVATFLRLRRTPGPWSVKQLLGVGLLTGVMCVQRPDTGLLAVFLTLPILFAWPKPGARSFLRLREASLLTLGALLVAAPYMTGNVLACGTAMPVSGKLKTHRAAVFRENSGWDRPREVFTNLTVDAPVRPAQAMLGWAGHEHEPWSRDSRFVLLGVVGALGAVGALRRRRANEPTAVGPLLLHGAVHCAVLAIYLFPFVEYGSWYLAPQTIAGVALAALALRGASTLVGTKVSAICGVLLVGGVALGTVRAELLHDEDPDVDFRVEAVALEVAQHLQDTVPEGQRIGCFNAGRIGYFTDRHVVNLDGLVNTNEFAETLWMSEQGSVSARLLRYLVDNDIYWLVDVWDARYPMAIVDRFFTPNAKRYFELSERWDTNRTYEKPVPGAYELVRLDIDAIRAQIDESEQASVDETPLEVATLDAIGYAAGTEPEPAELEPVVTMADADAVAPGTNLVVSGHAPEALLLDRDGAVLHRWSYRMTERWPDGRRPPRTNEDYWRRAAVLEDGSLLAIYEGLGLIKLDRNSELVWAYAGFAHHDLEVTDDGTIHVLTRIARSIPRLDPDVPVLDDRITTLAPDGTERTSTSVYECLAASEFASLLDEDMPAWDPFHTNTLEVLDGEHADAHPAFAAGNYLVSLRELDLLAVVDPREETVVWAARGDWKRQHQPTLVEGGRVLLFDNQGLGERSRVIELDPVTLEASWTYEEAGEGAMYSPILGSTQRLANGNTLVVESTRGRALEVNSAGDVLWEYRSPYRAGEGLRAALFDLVRLEGAAPAWIEAR